MSTGIMVGEFLAASPVVVRAARRHWRSWMYRRECLVTLWPLFGPPSDRRLQSVP